MKAILSGDPPEAGDAASQWCRSHLGPGDEVIVVVAMNALGELALGVPPLDTLRGDLAVKADVDTETCEPLREAGIECESGVVVASPAQALREMAQTEHADLIVIGKRFTLGCHRYGPAPPRSPAPSSQSAVVTSRSAPVEPRSRRRSKAAGTTTIGQGGAMTATFEHEHIDEPFLRYRCDGGRELRNDLVLEYAWLARSCARRFAGRGEPYDDLLQVAQLGVLKAVERYDPGRGVPFAGFAIPTVLGELRRHFRDHTWTVSPPRRIKELAVALGNALAVLEQQLRRAPSTVDLAEYLGVSEDDVLQAMAARRSYRLVPLFVLVSDDDHGDAIAEPDVDVVADSVTVRRVLGDLEPGEQRIVLWRYYDGLTQSEIARRLGISQAQVSRRLHDLLERLRAIVAEGGGAAPRIVSTSSG